MKRIVIVGTCGCGKTTLGKQLSQQLGITHTDLDNLYWLPNWTPRPSDEFEQAIIETVKEPSWIISGNQTKLRHLTWPHADAIIWLDLPKLTLIYRLLKRSFLQVFSSKTICNGNRETFSQFIWLLKHFHISYKRRKRNYTLFMKTEPNINLIHLTSTSAVKRFLSQGDLPQTTPL